MTGTREQVIVYIGDHPGSSAREIATAMRLSYQAVCHHVIEARKDGKIVSVPREGVPNHGNRLMEHYLAGGVRP